LGVIASDFDDDGLVDIFVANDSTPNFLYHNNGDGSFKEIGFPAGVAVNENGSEQGSMGVTLGDYDHDGRLDLFITNFDDDYNTEGMFTAVGERLRAPFLAKRTGRSAAVGDIDNDGDADVVINNLDGPPQLLRNDGGNANNSILIKTIGVKDNRDGIGARV